MRTFYCIISLLLLSIDIRAQQEFSLDRYKLFLQSNKDLNGPDLLQMHPAGIFTENQNFSPDNALYFDSIAACYNLTESERSLIRDNGFMVSERLTDWSMGHAFLDIWKKDLPVFISADAILHSLHMSYDEILKDCELSELNPNLKILLNKIYEQIPALKAKYASLPEMTQPLKDLDLYISVARKFFNPFIICNYAENRDKIKNIMSMIAALQPAEYSLFSDTPRIIDFSQFKVRGHYTSNEDLASYFQAMIWLGRTELYMSAPKAQFPAPGLKDIQRQTICAFLLQEAAEDAGVMELWSRIDNILRFFVGEPDNVTLNHILSLKELASINNASDLTDSLKLISFQTILKSQPYANQKILSQIIMTGFNEPDSIVPASAFLLFGQRFVIDSYIAAQVVFDRIIYNNNRVKRMLPSTLDILFALGNNAAAQLLQPELEKYHYGTNLAALRYLVDSYPDDFWRGTLYNNWLNSIRTLSPPDNRTNLPRFMQTAAYWQEKMNTQLASWAQLRHDNLLYAKQSYSGGITCSYPYSYVEPIPDFYEAVSSYCRSAVDFFSGLSELSVSMKGTVLNYFGFAGAVCDTLKEISVKELKNEELTPDEKSFLSRIITEKIECGGVTTAWGWYPRLFFHGTVLDPDYIVADIHTAPTDEAGAFKGWVLHAGTGRVNLGVFIAGNSSGNEIAYIGPVLSYHEHITNDFLRFSDEEWVDVYDKSPSVRPSFVNSYLADRNGGRRSEGLKLLTGIEQNESTPVPADYLLISNFPNPFNPVTTFSFTIPAALSNSHVRLDIYNIQGELVKELVNDQLPSGNFFVRWNGTTNSSTEAASGIYIYTLQAGDKLLLGKITLLK